jgi:SnoaL-like protein
VTAAFNRRDLEEVLELMDSGIEFYAPFTARSLARPASYQGHDGIRQYFDDVSADWESLQVIPGVSLERFARRRAGKDRRRAERRAARRRGGVGVEAP